jgi:hypothetical protein
MADAAPDAAGGAVAVVVGVPADVVAPEDMVEEEVRGGGS